MRSTEKNKVILCSVFILFVVVGILCIIAFVGNIKEFSKMTAPNRQSYKEYSAVADIACVAVDERTNIPTEPMIDFETLKAINTDIVAWIKIEGTVIDYPVVQGSDNSYYLDYTFERNKNITGSIFLDYRNNPDFSNRNNFLYGHNNTNSDLMFADLVSYREQEFYNAHSEILLYTPEAKYRCKVFSAYVTDSASETYTFNINSEDAAGDDKFSRYINIVVENSLITTNVDVSAIDNILTLSTCEYSSENSRFVVHAVMEKAGER